MPAFTHEMKTFAHEWVLYTLRSLRRLVRAKHGSLLMESAVTIAVFGILGAAVLGAVSTSNINKGKFDAQSTVENILRNQVESVFEEPYGTPDDPSYTTITPPNDYSVTVDTLPYEGNSEYDIQVVRITVFHRGEQVELFETIRTNRSQVFSGGYGQCTDVDYVGDLIVLAGPDDPDCTIVGTVAGNVDVQPGATLSVTGNIQGNIELGQSGCTQQTSVQLGDFALVNGNVRQRCPGEVNFTGNGVGAQVMGSVIMNAGFLRASGTSTTNHVDGDINCNGGAASPGSGGNVAGGVDYDGDSTLDGTLNGNYLC